LEKNFLNLLHESTVRSQFDTSAIVKAEVKNSDNGNEKAIPDRKKIYRYLCILSPNIIPDLKRFKYDNNYLYWD